MKNTLEQAFPIQRIEAIKSLLTDINAVGQRVVCLNGDILEIPYRIYNDLPNFSHLNNLSTQELSIIYCLYSRHSDGYIRQEMVKKLIEIEFQYFMIPYVFLLIGEYVVEIINDIYPLIEKNKDFFIEFMNNNHELTILTYQRMVSYWNEYYRYNRYKYLNDYPGKIIFNLFNSHLT
ncbi:hypothetical protein F4W09_04350 [Acinetobacter tandoii]|jgi:hypothetical protein|uniref:Uncharacterized protein n=1 Tax=Acinetobacter tandoii TaxID=202954 RepID=A0A5N4WL42_9GAMM|nr:hypothetical protein [Acinetobacter tandoii]KAB1857974.1 hypothetical protein F4W09_04350 [Acinetobacter tandoii]